jgi:hypothetical protein
MNHWKWIYACGILMFKFNILHFNIGFQRKPEKNLYLEKSGKHGAKKQEHFNCLLFHVSHFSYFTIGHIFSHVQNTFFIFFKRMFKTHLFRFCFKKTVKKCEQGAFWTCTWKCEKMRFENALGKMWNIVENVENNIWNPVGKVELWFFSSSVIFLGPVLLQLLCCLPNFCKLKIE